MTMVDDGKPETDDGMTIQFTSPNDDSESNEDQPKIAAKCFAK
jgi:hypothetical protein